MALCVIERRGAAVWLRRGHAGGKGRITSIVLSSEALAGAEVEAELAARLAEGFVVTDPARTVSDPFRAHDAPRTTRRLEPREVVCRVRGAMPTLPASFTIFFSSFCDAARLDTAPRLARLELEGFEGERVVEIALTYASGSGENPDDYVLDRRVFLVQLEGPCPCEIDGVELDVFADDLRRVRGTTLLRRFDRAVRALPRFADLAEIRVSRVEDR